MKTKNFALVLLSILFAAQIINAQCVYTFQPGPQTGKDAQVFSIPCNSSFAQTFGVCDTSNQGNVDYIEANAWTWMSTPAIIRALFEFNFTPIENIGCNVQKAVMVLYHPTNVSGEFHCGDTSTLHPCDSNNLIVNRISQSWDEMTINWNNQPSVSNTIQEQDYVSVGDNSAPYLTYEIDITGMVNYWIANPDSNFGLRIALATESIYRRVVFASSDYFDESRRPKLIVWLDCSSTNHCTNLISGNIFDDTNTNNCTKDSTDRSLAGWFVKIEPGPMYAITDANGYYEAWVDTDTYTITEITPTVFWQPSCPASRIVTFTTTDDTSANNDFAMKADKFCSSLWVDITTNRLRPMHDENYIVNYCNNGNLAADSVYIEVKFDDYIVPNFSSPISPSAQNGNVWTYFIGTLAAGQCGMFYINTTVNSTTAGITQCVEAIIYPNTFCDEDTSTGWDKSSLKVEGECVGDSVRFVIYNTGDAGDGDMDGSSPYRIYVNDTLVLTSSLQINGGDSLVIMVNACGNTIRLEADQRPGHPGHSHPRATVEGCGSSCGQVTMGHVTSVLEDDEDIFVEMDCHEIVTSYDPNEKLVMPKGVSSNKYIRSTDELEYTMNFQNTGKDTAFLIIVRDTLPNYLDLTTVKSGASSHNYSLKVYNNNVVEWTFKNINLVDSTTNEAMSHGFVKFTVKQKPNNADGTIISNSGGIYFDYNAPVQTEKVTVIVNDNFLTGIKKEVVEKKAEVKIMPNPFSKNAVLRITNFGELRITNVELKVYDLLGKELKADVIRNSDSFVISSKNLNSGLYFYKLYSGEKQIAVGKMMIQK